MKSERHSRSELAGIWKQKAIPVIFRRGSGEKLMVKVPYQSDNMLWLKGNKRIYPEFDNKFKCWNVPVAWFEDLSQRIINRYGQVYVIQALKREQKCAPACWNAAGLHCECSCMGARHGTGNPNGCWHVVSDTFAVAWEEREYSCRLLKQNNAYRALGSN